MRKTIKMNIFLITFLAEKYGFGQFIQIIYDYGHFCFTFIILRVKHIFMTLPKINAG